MGDSDRNPAADDIAAILSSDLPADVKLRTIDRLRGGRGRYARADSPEERRRRFYVIRGGAAVAALGFAWQVLRRPPIAAATGATGVGALALPGLLAGAPAPIERPDYSPPPVVVPAPEPLADDDVTVETPAKRATVAGLPSAPPEVAIPEPTSVEPTYIRVPEPTAEPEPTATPSETPTPTPSATREPVLDVDLDDELCVGVNLPKLVDLDACL